MQKLLSVFGMAAFLLAAACDRVPSDPVVLLGLAHQTQKDGDVGRGIIFLKKALESKPDYDAARLLLAEFYLELNQPEIADSQLQKVSSVSRTEQYYRFKARTLAWLGRYDDLLALPVPDFSNPSAGLEFQGYRVDALVAKGQFDAAHTLIEQLKQQGAGGPFICVRQASLEFSSGALHDARQRLLSCEADNALSSDYWMLRSAIERSLSLYAFSFDSLQKVDAIEAKPYLTRNRMNAGVNRAILHIRLGNAQTARDEIKVIGPATVPVLWGYVNSLLYFRSQDYKAANDELQKLFRINPDYYPGIELMQQVKYLLGQTNQAREFAAKMVTMQLGFGGQEYSRQDLQKALVQNYITRGDYEQALQELSQLGEDNVDLLLLREYIRSRQSGKGVSTENVRKIERAHLGVQDQKKILRFYLDSNLPAEADRLMNALFKHAQADGDLIEIRARTLLQQGRQEDLGRFLDANSGKYPHILVRIRAEQLARTRGMDAAIGYLQRNAPKSMDYQLLLADLYARNGEFSPALTIVKGLEKGSKGNVLLIRKIADLSLRAGDKAMAMEKYGYLIQNEPHEAGLFVSLARAQFNAGDYTGAKRNIESALVLQEDNLDALKTYLEIELAHNAGNAMNVLNRYGRRIRDEEDVLVLRGWIYERLQQTSEAQRVYEAALRDHPDSHKILPNLLALKERADADAAEKWLQEYVASSKDIYPGLLLADFHMRQEKYLQSNAVYRGIIDRQGGDAVIYNNMAWNHYRLGEMAQALQYAGQALELLPGDPQIQDTYGWLLVQSGDAKKGLPYLRSAQFAMPDERTVSYHVATALVQDGQRAEARRYLERLLNDGAQFPERAEAESIYRKIISKG